MCLMGVPLTRDSPQGITVQTKTKTKNKETNKKQTESKQKANNRKKRVLDVSVGTQWQFQADPGRKVITQIIAKSF